MPVRKSPAKKTVTKKAPVKKTTTKPAASASSGTDYETLGKLVLAAIKSGELDFMIVKFDDALTARINKQIKASENKSAATAPKEKTASAPPKRTPAAKKSLTLTANKFYKIGDQPAKLKGAKVKFLKEYTKDKNKAVVEMGVDKPGYPKGKRVVLPKSALVAAAR